VTPEEVRAIARQEIADYVRDEVRNQIEAILKQVTETAMLEMQLVMPTREELEKEAGCKLSEMPASGKLLDAFDRATEAIRDEDEQ